jgi:hypothetical protein
MSNTVNTVDKVKFKVGDIVKRKLVDKSYGRNYGKVCDIDGGRIWSSNWVGTSEEASKLPQENLARKTWVSEESLLVIQLSHHSKLSKAVLEQSNLIAEMQQQLKEAQERLDKLRLLLDNEGLLNEIYFT